MRRDPHTQSFVSNHVKKLVSVEGRQLLCECLRGLSDFRERISELLCHLNEVQRCLKSSFLSAEEIQHLCVSSEEFVLLYNDTFEDSSLTPKAHISLHHRPYFAEEHHFIGLMSEQGIEALHHQFNKTESRFLEVKDEETRWRRILLEFAMKNALFDREAESEAANDLIQNIDE